MNSAGISAGWLRKVRRLTYAVIGVFTLLGLGMTWRAAMNGLVAEAIAGAVVTLGVLGSGMVWSISIRLSLNALRTGRRLRRVERRLQRVFGRQPLNRRVGAGVSNSESARISSLVGRLERFCDAQEESSKGMERRLTLLEQESSVKDHRQETLNNLDDPPWADSTEPPGERTVAAYQHLTDPNGLSDSMAGVNLTREGEDEKQILRMEFAALIHREDYAGALATGDGLLSRFPESKAATDFRRVRPHLVRKIQLRESSGSAGN